MPGQYRTVSKLRTTEAAYIAGLIDGEGTIALSRRHRNEERQLVVSISNTERSLLEYVLKTVGAGRITAKRTYKSQHSPSFTYAIGNRQALALLDQIALYLRTYKAERARLIIQNYLKLTPRNGRYTDLLRKERRQFEERFHALSSNRGCHTGVPLKIAACER